MAQLFISYSEPDGNLAVELARALEECGYTTWYYERDSVPGLSYLLQTGRAIVGSSVFIVLISHDSLVSSQVTKEIVRAHEENKAFVPIMCGITHLEFQSRQQEWREAIGPAVSVALPPEGVVGIIHRLKQGLDALEIQPVANGRFVTAESNANLESETTQSGHDRQDIKSKRILIVDDEESMRLYLGLILKKHGFVAINSAESGEEGLTSIREFQPDIVLADLSLPGMSGVEMMHVVQSSPEVNQPKFLIISAYCTPEIMRDFEAAGTPFLPKHASNDELLDALEKLDRQAIRRSPVLDDCAVPSLSLPRNVADDDRKLFEECRFEFTDHCRGHLLMLGISEKELLDLVLGEFRSHTNYLRYDLENYPLPVKSGYIVYIKKTGSDVEFSGLIKCTSDQAKLASWNDILALYRRATRLSYRSEPERLLLVRGALGRVLGLHLDLRTRIVKHFVSYDQLPLDTNLACLGNPEIIETEDSAGALAGEIAFHLQESTRAAQESVEVGRLHDYGDMTLSDAMGVSVMEVERSLQHIHKIITGYPPVA